jgi:hypothetical protein
MYALATDLTETELSPLGSQLSTATGNGDMI